MLVHPSFFTFFASDEVFFSLRMNVSEVDNLTPSTLLARRLKTVLVPLLGFLRLFGWLGEAFLALFFCILQKFAFKNIAFMIECLCKLQFNLTYKVFFVLQEFSYFFVSDVMQLDVFSVFA